MLTKDMHESPRKTMLVNYRNPLLYLKHDKITPIDRQSVFGNPFPMADESEREIVIGKYRTWFAEKMWCNCGFRNDVDRLRGKVLGCWCTPLPCHGDIIIEYLEGVTSWAKDLQINTG